MLKNIKSLYFIKLIFLYLDEPQKLKLIKYNKNLQKNINISIINYKYLKGKFIEYSSKGIGKEYYYYGDNKILIYEGEFSNGQRNGKGKVFYDNDILMYESEYLKGKKTGKGKEYHRNGKLLFEGEYLNDRELFGNKYDEKGNLIDKINHIKGEGKDYNDYGKIIFEGDYLNGKRHGKGKEYFDDGNILFEGEYKNDLKWEGKGYDEMNNKIYELKNGKGFIKELNFFTGKLRYEGDYLNGKRHGYGKEYWNDCLEYAGEYLNGKKMEKEMHIIFQLVISVL